MPRPEPWLLLMHQLPPKPDSLRVRVWRALQKIGALQLKNSVYVLPSGPENEGRFGSVLQEIISGKGDAFLCKAEFVQGIEHEEIVEEFNQDRNERYKAHATELRELQKFLGKKKPSENDLMAIEHSLGKLDRQIQELKAIDFFDCEEQAPTLKLLKNILSRIDDLRSGARRDVSKQNLAQFQGKAWVTRKDIRVDRLASAWLITRFIDRKATFKFVGENNYSPRKNEIRFDMFDAEFTHVGDKCTFEVLVEAFSLKEKSIRFLAEIIHDLDLKDTKFNRPETAGIGAVLKALIGSEASDEERFKKALELFDGLKESN